MGLTVAALSGDGKKTIVEVVKGGKITAASVVPGLRNRRHVEVKSGLQEGDVVRVRSVVGIAPNEG